MSTAQTAALLCKLQVIHISHDQNYGVGPCKYHVYDVAPFLKLEILDSKLNYILPII